MREVYRMYWERLDGSDGDAIGSDFSFAQGRRMVDRMNAETSDARFWLSLPYADIETAKKNRLYPPPEGAHRIMMRRG